MNWISLEILWKSTIVWIPTVIPDWWGDQILKQYISKIASSFNRKKIGNLHQFVRKTISYGYEVRFSKSKFNIHGSALVFIFFILQNIINGFKCQSYNTLSFNCALFFLTVSYILFRFSLKICVTYRGCIRIFNPWVPKSVFSCGRSV